MTEQVPSHARAPTRYEIVVRGELSSRFGSAFRGIAVHARGGRTYIVGDVIDQSQLHGLLERIRSLGIELISITPLAEDAADTRSSEAPAEGTTLTP
jgi:hypothetical protein